MTGRFWEKEEPQVIEGRFIDWKYFPVAGKLQVIKKRMTDTGLQRKTVTIDVRDLTPDVRELLEKFMGE